MTDQTELQYTEEHEWVLVEGDTLTIGDIPVGASCYRYYGLPIERPELPHVARWYARLKRRKPFHEHVMVPIT